MDVRWYWWGRDKTLGSSRWSKMWDKGWNVSEKGEKGEGDYQSQRGLDRITRFLEGRETSMVGVHIFIQGNGQSLPF